MEAGLKSVSSTEMWGSGPYRHRGSIEGLFSQL